MADTLLGGIAINEILADPNGANNFDTDGNGVARGADEFVELINTSDSAIDISGLQLWDRGRDNWFTFPPGTVLEPGAVAVVVRNVQSGGSLPSVSGDDLAFDANFGSGVFNNNQDNVVVYDPTNDEFIQATYNGDTLDDPVGGPGYSGFSGTATRVGTGEDFGTDLDGFSIQRTDSGFVNDETPTPGSDIACFVSGTQIETSVGFTPIEALRVGDLVNTMDAGWQPVRWISARRVTPEQQRTDARLTPISISMKLRQGACSNAPLLVSRQHRLLIEGRIAQRMFGKDQVLAPAKDLIDGDSIRLHQIGRSFYFLHILLDGHHILNANGIAAESLFLGREAAKTLTPAEREELSILLPGDDLRTVVADFHPSRHICAGARVRRLVKRHNKNNRTIPTAFPAASSTVRSPHSF